MKYHNVEQNSPEWYALRAGVITASMFKVARERTGGLTEQQKIYVDALRSGMDEAAAKEKAGYKSKPRMTETLEKALRGEEVCKPSTGAEAYALELAMERISGAPKEEAFSTWQMERGQQLEGTARLLYETEKGVLIERAGFITSDCGNFGASSDGRNTIENAGIEIKCLVSGSRLKTLLIDQDLSEFLDQIHGNIWLGDLSYMDFVLYVPALENANRELVTVRIDRDQDYIDALVADLERFNQLVTQYERILRTGTLTHKEAA